MAGQFLLCKFPVLDLLRVRRKRMGWGAAFYRPRASQSRCSSLRKGLVGFGRVVGIYSEALISAGLGGGGAGSLDGSGCNSLAHSSDGGVIVRDRGDKSRK